LHEYNKCHPYAIESGMDHSKEPTTLVTFRLDEMPDGVQLTVTESGFDQIPLSGARRLSPPMTEGGAIRGVDLEVFGE
jgi:hypothetical protein